MDSKNAVDHAIASTPAQQCRIPKWLRAAMVFATLAGTLGLVFAFDIDRFLTLDALAENGAWLLEQVANNAVAVATTFIVIYAVAVALSVPGAAVLTISGGFLFGTVVGALFAVTGATLGAIALFLFVKAGLGDALTARAGSAVDRLRKGFQENALGYLLFLRLLPVFPFFIVNLAAAILHIPLRTFAIATLVGISPGSLVYASIGSGLGFVIANEREVDLGVIFAPEVLLPLAGLALLSLAPIVYKRFKRFRAAEGA